MVLAMRATSRDRQFLSALVFFSRVAAHRSFTAAARDLYVTTSAVSHQITALEAALGVRLFFRKPGEVTLTREGQQFAAQVTRLFEEFERSILDIKGRKVLRVSVGPFLSTRWLLPRLAVFEREAKDVRVDLVHRPGWPNLKEVDLAIVWADKPRDLRRAELLFRAEIAPVCAPSIPDTPACWQTGLPALHYGDRRAWRYWLECAGAPVSYARDGEIFDDPNLVIEAAAHGRGIALGFLPFVASDLERGRLKLAHPLKAPSPFSYWLVPGRSDNPVSAQFADWLRREAARSSEALERRSRAGRSRPRARR